MRTDHIAVTRRLGGPGYGHRAARRHSNRLDGGRIEMLGKNALQRHSRQKKHCRMLLALVTHTSLRCAHRHMRNNRAASPLSLEPYPLAEFLTEQFPIPSRSRW